MAWMETLQTVGTGLWWVLKGLFTTLYLITSPLHYTLYYIVAFIAFLLSPIWYMIQGVVSVVLFVGTMIAKLKYLYYYLACAAIAGILAGLVAHGTSSYLFILLGVDLSSQQRDEREARRRQSLQEHLVDGKAGGRMLPSSSDAMDPDEYIYYDDEWSDPDTSPSGRSGRSTTSLLKDRSFSSQSTSSKFSRGSSSNGGRENIPPGLLRGQGIGSGLGDGGLKPRRRRKGLLAQTIHEESSESDFS